MKCPSCSAPGKDEAEECAVCGVNFAKWRAKAEKAAAEAEFAAEAARLYPSPPPAAPASTLKMTLGVLGVLCAAVLVAYGVAHRTVDPPPAQGGILVRPEAYRPRLSAIEAALYRAGPPTPADAKFIADETISLAGIVLERDQQNPLVRETVGDLMEFAGVVAPPEDGALLPNARIDWARRWEVIRGRRFEKASWLHAPVTADDGPPPDFERAAARIQTAGHRLKTLLADLPPQVERFGKDDVDAADVKRFGAPALEKVQQWREWRSKWQAEVDQALLGFPKPDEIPQELQAPYDRLVLSAREARNPPTPKAPAGDAAVYLPGKEARDAWIQGVNTALSEIDDGIGAARQAKAAPKDD